MLTNTVTTVLNINRCHIPCLSMRNLFEALKDNSTLQELRANSNMIDDAAAEALAVFLAATPALRLVTLASMGLGDVICGLICKALSANHSLEQLDLRDNQLTQASGTCLASLIKSNDTLTTLIIEANPLDDRGFRPIASALMFNYTLCRLHISDTSITATSVDLLAHTLRANQTLHSLSIASNPIPIESVTDLIWQNPLLRYLDISDIDSKGAGPVHTLVALRHNHLLRKLLLEDTDLERATLALAKLVARAGNLTHLSLAGARISNRVSHIEALAAAFSANNSLVDLDLSYTTSLGPNLGRMLISTIHLTSLDISHCSLHALSHATDVARLTESSTTLLYILAVGNDLGGKRGMDKIIEAIRQHNTTLREISMGSSKHQLEPEQHTLLAQTLIRNQCTTTTQCPEGTAQPAPPLVPRLPDQDTETTPVNNSPPHQTPLTTPSARASPPPNCPQYRTSQDNRGASAPHLPPIPDQESLDQEGRTTTEQLKCRTIESSIVTGRHACPLDFRFRQSASSFGLLTRMGPDHDDQPDYNTNMAQQLELGHNSPFDQYFGKNEQWTHPPPDQKAPSGSPQHGPQEGAGTPRAPSIFPPVNQHSCTGDFNFGRCLNGL
jgi:hypothetical protein